MQRVQFSLEVEPMDERAIDQVKSRGGRVLEGHDTWRVVATIPVHGNESVRAQAHSAASEYLAIPGVRATTKPPAMSLRDPDGLIDTAGASLVLDEVRRSYDPDPRPRPKRKWYQVAMELGLGERKV